MITNAEIKRNMTSWDFSAGDRSDPVAVALRRLHLRVELCPCGGEDSPAATHCVQCKNDLDAIEAAWMFSGETEER